MFGDFEVYWRQIEYLSFLVPQRFNFRQVSLAMRTTANPMRFHLVWFSYHVDIDIEKVEDLLRQDQAYQALDYGDKVVLKNKPGFDNFMINKIRSAWEQLRDRRVGRK